MLNCPKFDWKNNIAICPECGKELDGEEVEYCGNNCSNDECGWSHCGQCV